MSTPPSGNNSEEWPPDEPESGYQHPPAYAPPPAYVPPPGYPYYGTPPPPGYPHQQWQSPPPASRIAVGMVFAGCAAWAVINVIVAFAAIIVTSGAAADNNNMVVGVGAFTLAAIAFGGGGGLLATRNRYVKGLGLGLMIGWALTSLFTVGFCTGINPGMYTL